jgi:hypothetical protein
MKSLWTILAVVAVANILTIAALVGWLHQSGRLNRERAMAVKQVFSKTVEQERADKAEAEAAARAEQERLKAEAKAAEPPLSASDVIADRQFRDEQRAQVLQRQQRDLENLRAGLMAKLADLESREKKLAADREAFAAERKRIAETEGQEQFRKALATLEGQRPRDAKAVLRSMLETRQGEQVIAYLSKMDESKRSKIVAEFVKDDPALAADLLERLRTRGMAPPGSPSSPAQAVANDPSQP